MRPLSDFSPEARRSIRWLLADIDDTITTDGRLTADAFAAMERLTAAGFAVVPITGRPAGWCDHIARMWPVAAVVGENGAFYFRYDAKTRTLERRFMVDAKTRTANRLKLKALARRILTGVPGTALASDQDYRDADLAIDYCEDVPPLPRKAVDRIVRLMTAAGAHAKVSSIHVNCWFGDYDKLAMTRILFRERFGVALESVKDSVVFVGDSPNDEPMFGFFPRAVGVANVRDFEDRIRQKPAFVTRARGGQGFAELAAALLAVCKGRPVSGHSAPTPGRRPRKR